MADDKTTEDKTAAESGDNTIAKSDKEAPAKSGKAKPARTKAAKSEKSDKAEAKADKGDKGEGKVEKGESKTTKPAKKATKAAAKPRAKATPKADKDEKAKEAKPDAKVADDKTKAAEPPAAEESSQVASTDKAATKATKPKSKGKRTKEDDIIRFYGTGRRKEATARVFLRPGNGDFVVNKKPIEDFFPRARSQMVARQALKVMGEHGESGFDVYATVSGGGESGQAEAVRHGISRAMVAYRPDCKPILRAAGFIARDARAVERKKVGLRKARRARQYSKR